MSTKLHELIEKAMKPTIARTMAEYEAALASGHARQQLAARCNPETMKAALEALESCQKHSYREDGELQWYYDFDSERVETALKLLNGESP